MRTFLSVLIWLYWALCIIVFLFLITILFLLTFPFDKYRRIPNKVLVGLGWLMLKVNPGWNFHFMGVDRLKVKDPSIVVSNHQSFLDMPLIYLLPWKMKWVAKKSLFKIPILGWIIFMTGQIGIDRESRRSVRKLDKLVEPIKQGIPGMIFPEGTRSNDGRLKSFKNGAFFLAERYNFKVLPIVLDGGYRAMPPGSWRLNLNLDFTVSVMEPLDPDNFKTAADLKKRTHNVINEELIRIREKNIHN